MGCTNQLTTGGPHIGFLIDNLEKREAAAFGLISGQFDIAFGKNAHLQVIDPSFLSYSIVMFQFAKGFQSVLIGSMSAIYGVTFTINIPQFC